YTHAIDVQRTWGTWLLGAGAAVTVGGAGFLVWNGHRASVEKDEYESVLYDSERFSGRRCDPARSDCHVELTEKYDTWRSTKSHDLYGWIAVSAGAAAM